jgi:acyl-CoA thioester hydrolase
MPLSISAAAAPHLCQEVGGNRQGCGMAEWTETFRGAVAPWECDTTEHFTIAYYLDRIDQASTTLADLIGLADRQRAGIWPRRFVLRFLRELRAGASFHIESAPLGLDPGLRLGHRVVDSGNGEIVTWIEELWEQMAPSDVERAAIGRRLAVWQGPSIEERPEPNSMAGAIAAARGRTRPADLDEFGRFSLAAFVHRFTDAVIQTCAALGMTDDFMKTARRGYSTFELVLRIVGVPRLGDPYLVETGIAQLGGSSLRLLHRMSDPVSGTEFARLGQFGVQLDLDVRRPAPLPEAVRDAAAPLLLPFA